MGLWFGTAYAKKLPGLRFRRPRPPPAEAAGAAGAEDGPDAEPDADADADGSSSESTCSSEDESLHSAGGGSHGPDESGPEDGPAVAPIDDDAADRGVDHRIDVPFVGSIVWYNKDGRFVAMCGVADHNIVPSKVCSRERTSKEGGQPQRGRPLGFLMAWLLDGPAWGQKDEHCDKHLAVYSHADRLHAREQLKLVPGSEVLFALERPKRLGEADEPAGQP